VINRRRRRSRGRGRARRLGVARWTALGVVTVAFAVTATLYGYANRTPGGAPIKRPGALEQMALDPATGPILSLSGDDPSSVRLPSSTVALTFDDGPDPTWTPQILDLLDRYGAKATFFVVGRNAARHPDLLREMVARGHDVAPHTFTHANLAALPPWEASLQLSLTESTLAAVVGEHPRILRPPYSSTPTAVTVDDLRSFRAAADRGYLIALSDLDSRDWDDRVPVEGIVANATPPDGAGAVVLLHDAGGDRTRTVAALDRLLHALGERGYRFVSLSTALAEQGRPVPTAVPSGWAGRLAGRALAGALALGAWLTGTMRWLAVLLIAAALGRAAVLVVAARRHRRRLARPSPYSWVTPPAVAVVVPAYNEEVGIATTVRSIVASDYAGPIEVVVVDDGSTDGTAAAVEQLLGQDGMAGVRLLRQPNGGKPAALNAGVRATTAPIVVMVDGDTVFAPDTIANAVRRFADPSVAAVAGNTKIGNRRGLLGRFQHLEYVFGFNLDRRAQEELGCMPTVPGAIGAFRREALDAVGGVSDDTLAEDTDLTMALHRGRWRVVYEPRSVAWTEAPSSWRGLWRQRFRWSYGTLQAVWKHRRALMSDDPARRRFGRRALPYMLVFQVLCPLVGPFLDAATMYALAFSDTREVVGAWLAFNALHMALSWYALRLDHEPRRVLWCFPLQQFVFRQLMYLVLWDAVLAALGGIQLRWQKLDRVGLGEVPAPLEAAEQAVTKAA